MIISFLTTFFGCFLLAGGISGALMLLVVLNSMQGFDFSDKDEIKETTQAWTSATIVGGILLNLVVFGIQLIMM